MTNKDKVAAIFREIFEEPELELSDDLDPRSVTNWNSFTFLTLILRLEEEFGVSFPPDEVQAVNNAGDILRMVGAHASAA
jgi:acyl carrier protein